MTAHVNVEKLRVEAGPQGQAKTIVHDVSFTLKPKYNGCILAGCTGPMVAF